MIPVYEEFVGTFKQAQGLSAAQLEQFYLYLKFLLQWNQRINLTGHNDWRDVVVKDFQDSLVILPYIKDTSLMADLGSGGGLPGLPLAIALPDAQLCLVEPRRKRCVFLREMVQQLGLSPRVNVFEGRAQELIQQRPAEYSAVVSRGTFKVSQYIEVATPLLNTQGQALLMKGPNVTDELEALSETIKQGISTHDYKLEGSDYARCLITWQCSTWNIA